ncbi:MAG TPA: endonuclease III [Blastocatellia bacterium]|nr:endonuclease III [Blastocatellia bacterium]
MKAPSISDTDLEEKRHMVRHVIEHLEAAYGVPVNDSADDPLDELILTILSQSTTNINSHRAFQSLKQRFPGWEAVRRARPDTIAEAIRSGGLARIKSVVIKNILNEIRNRRGALDLSFLRTASVAEAREFLSSLKGVGPKTVGCVLLFACKLPVFPMDTHIFRIARRMGLIPPKGSDSQAHSLMESLIPESKHYSLHINLIRHGRKVCRPQNPRCENCCLIEYCDLGQSLI